MRTAREPKIGCTEWRMENDKHFDAWIGIHTLRRTMGRIYQSTFWRKFSSSLVHLRSNTICHHFQLQMKEVDTLLGEINVRMNQNRYFEKHYNELQSISNNIIENIDDLEAVLSSVSWSICRLWVAFAIIFLSEFRRISCR